MGICCNKEDYTNNSSIEYEEYDNYIPMMFGLENMNTDFREKLFSLRKSMSISFKGLRKNFTAVCSSNFKKETNRKQSIKELHTKHKENNKEEVLAEPDIDVELSLEHESLIRKILIEKNMVTPDIEEDTMNEIISSFYIARIKKDTKLFHEGEPASLFFINFQGNLIKIKGKEARTITPGVSFGEDALTPNSTRKSSVKAKTDATLLCIFGEAYRNAMEVSNAKGIAQRVEIVKSIYLFKQLSEDLQKSLASRLKKRSFTGTILNEGDFFEKIFFIISGSVSCKKNSTLNKTLQTGDYFGEVGLFLEATAYYTYEGSLDVVLYELEFYQVAEQLGHDFANVLIEGLFKGALRNSLKLNEYFAGDGVSALLNIFHLEYYKNDDIVFTRNLRINKKICVVLSGKLVKMSDKSVVVAEREDWFGEDIIDSTENLETDLVPEDECLVYEAYWSDILKSSSSNTSNNFSIYARIANLKKNPIFSVLSEFKLFLLCKEFQPLEFQHNEEIKFQEITVMTDFYDHESKLRKINSSNLNYENNINHRNNVKNLNHNTNLNLNKSSSFNGNNNTNNINNTGLFNAANKITNNTIITKTNKNLSLFGNNNPNNANNTTQQFASATVKNNSMINFNNKLNIPNNKYNNYNNSPSNSNRNNYLANNSNNYNNSNNSANNLNIYNNTNTNTEKHYSESTNIQTTSFNNSNNYIKITNVNTYNTNNFSSTYNLECKTNSLIGGNGLNTSTNNSNNFTNTQAPTNAGALFQGREKSKFSGSAPPETFFNPETILISKIFIIYEGKIKFSKNGIFIKELQTNGIFADISYGLNVPDKSGDIAVAEGTVKCYCISAKTFRENVDENYFNYIQSILVLQDTSVKLESLFFVKNVGYGKYGKVFLVHNRKNLYALKAAELRSIRKEPYLVRYYMNEKVLMQQIDHPFIVKLVKTMKNYEMIFFLMEFIDGVTLKFYLEKRGKNDNKIIAEAQFLGAILLIIVNYLHKKRIIHRDIKPDNIMVDQSGYLKLIDFGISKEMKDKDYTTTLVGTPHYIAPEIILGKGYSFSSDYWSIGVCMFEIFYGFLPFGNNSKDVIEIYSQILKRNLDLSSNPKYNDINNFLKIILNKSLNQRIYNYTLLTNHPLFENFEIERLIQFNMKSPLKFQKFVDTSYSKRMQYLNNLNNPLIPYLNMNMYSKEYSYDSYEEPAEDKDLFKDF